MKCEGKLADCKDADNHCYLGDGIFTCCYYDSTWGVCELKERSR